MRRPAGVDDTTRVGHNHRLRSRSTAGSPASVTGHALSQPSAQTAVPEPEDRTEARVVTCINYITAFNTVPCKQSRMIQLNLLANAEGKAPRIGTTTAAVIIQPVIFRVCDLVLVSNSFMLSVLIGIVDEMGRGERGTLCSWLLYTRWAWACTNAFSVNFWGQKTTKRHMHRIGRDGTTNSWHG
ncbi:hypothetical protein P692DRAFT_20819633 [Suillus brevipes Sb2]|nr:hypothetical protein P692DRAFT_20819633 [Suillus brevipes Sb2]